MKSTGIIRKVDGLGRVVLPAETRRLFDINVDDSLEIFTDEDTVVLRKYEPGCVFCGESSGCVEFKGKLICPNCYKDL